MELWTYYRVSLGSTGGVITIRLTGESNGRIFGLEVDDHGTSLRRHDGTLRFHVLDRATITQMVPLTLFGGRLVTAEKSHPEERDSKKAVGTQPILPPK